MVRRGDSRSHLCASHDCAGPTHGNTAAVVSNLEHLYSESNMTTEASTATMLDPLPCSTRCHARPACCCICWAALPARVVGGGCMASAWCCGGAQLEALCSMMHDSRKIGRIAGWLRLSRACVTADSAFVDSVRSAFREGAPEG